MYNGPKVLIDKMLEAGRAKLKHSVPNMVLRSALAAGILSLAVCLAVTTSVQTQAKIAGAVIFPAGFCILILLGLDLVTGNFALCPLPLFRQREGERPFTIKDVLNNWTWVFVGNLLGSLAVAVLVAISMTNGFSGATPPETNAIVGIAEAKTLGFEKLGAAGMLPVFVRAILCNWMVTLGVVMGMTSESVGGKIAAMWLPIMLFFGLGYEHAVVNMFVIPLGMLLGAQVTVAEWWIWNQIPVTLGNMLGGLVFTGLGLYCVHGLAPPAARAPSPVVPASSEPVGGALTAKSATETADAVA